MIRILSLKMYLDDLQRVEKIIENFQEHSKSAPYGEVFSPDIEKRINEINEYRRNGVRLMAAALGMECRPYENQRVDKIAWVAGEG